MARLELLITSVPEEDDLDAIVVPLLRALGQHGIHANLEPTRNQAFQGDAVLVYSLFPGGEITFNFFATDFGSRHALVDITEIPHGCSLTEENVLTAVAEFKDSFIERELFSVTSKLTRGDSFRGSIRTSTSAGLASTSHSTGAGAKSGCYIATAVYGDYDAAEVRILRRFRDERLQTQPTGRFFVRVYYRLGPSLVARLGARSWFSRLLRPLLDRVAHRLRACGYSDSPYDDVRC